MPLTLHDITCDDAYRGVLSALLRDRSQPNSTGSIIWATGAYANHGVGYAGSDMMTVETVRHLVSIGELVPRCEKDADTQRRRTADKAEVFTPSWLCNDMINGIEECEFGEGARPFNDEADGPRGWKATDDKISFPDGGMTGGAGSGKRLVPAKPRWYRYIGLRCLEITCGEAPYLTSRYDAVTNEPIPQAERIGFLDRKIRVAVENTPAGNAERKKAIDRALSSVYGFEYQGDNLFLARMNILLTWHEAVYGTADGAGDAPHRNVDGDRWDKIDALTEAANTISRNIVQMDGITLTVPRREQGGEEPAIETGGSLFGQWGETGENIEPGNADNYVKNAHNSTDGMPVYACIYNGGNKRVTFRDMIDGRGRRTMAFDFVIGNPPYHKDGGGRKKIPIYGKFMESFSDPKIAKRATFVTPDGFVKGGQQLEPLRRALVDNDHLSRVTFHQDKVFKQSVNAAITTFDNTSEHNSIDKTIVHADGTEEKGTLDWKYRDVVVNEDKELVRKIFEEKVKAGENNMSKIVTGRSPFGLKTACFRSYENQFLERPDDQHFMKMLVGAAKKGGEKRDFYWVCPSDNFQRNEGRNRDEAIHLEKSEKWKFTFPMAVANLNKRIPPTCVLAPGVICTDKYLCIFTDSKIEAVNVNKYFLSNFYRVGIACIVPKWIIPRGWHALVPVQDFSNDSDIDWSGSLKSIDEQLYRKYGFTDDDIEAINRFVTPAPGYADPFAYADPRIERNDFASPSLYTVSDTLGDTADGGSVVEAGGVDSAGDACGAGGAAVDEADVPSGGDVVSSVASDGMDSVSDEDVAVDGDVDIADGGECVE